MLLSLFLRGWGIYKVQAIGTRIFSTCWSSLVVCTIQMFYRSFQPWAKMKLCFCFDSFTSRRHWIYSQRNESIFILSLDSAPSLNKTWQYANECYSLLQVYIKNICNGIGFTRQMGGVFNSSSWGNCHMLWNFSEHERDQLLFGLIFQTKFF